MLTRIKYHEQGLQESFQNGNGILRNSIFKTNDGFSKCMDAIYYPLFDLLQLYPRNN